MRVAITVGAIALLVIGLAGCAERREGEIVGRAYEPSHWDNGFTSGRSCLGLGIGLGGEPEYEPAVFALVLRTWKYDKDKRRFKPNLVAMEVPPLVFSLSGRGWWYLNTGSRGEWQAVCDTSDQLQAYPAGWTMDVSPEQAERVLAARGMPVNCKQTLSADAPEPLPSPDLPAEIGKQ